MNAKKRAALYARFSTEMQRMESIDAQLRAMRNYCKKNGWEIAEEYIDEAVSATTDRRPAFQRMIADSGKKQFEIVLVHKLDRFSRSRYDSANYKYLLRKNGVRLCSVLEHLDDSPESVILEGLLESMAEYYSLNLARSVLSGMKENALQCRSNGGIPPLGYDVDDHGHLIVNEYEAIAVRIIYEMYNNGYSTRQIASFLNAEGFRTKFGNLFTHMAFFEILQNEKYTGVFVYNTIRSKDRNRRRKKQQKPENEIIRVEGGCPAIITKEVFERAQAVRKQNQKNAGKFNGKLFYLCSGIIICGCCGKRMHGSKRYCSQPFSEYICSTPKALCGNTKEVSRDKIDRCAETLLQRELFNEPSLQNRLMQLQSITGKDIDFADYLHLLTDYERIQRGVPPFRTFVQQYLMQVTINRETVVFTLNTGYDLMDLTEDFEFERKLFCIPSQSKRQRRETHEL